MLIFIVAGLTTGSIFGLVAVGVVLTYKTSGIFNFAHGALATLSAFLFYFLYSEHQIPWPIAAALCILVAGPVVGFGLEILARRLGTRDLPTRVVGTVGLILLIQGGLDLLYPPGPRRSVNQFLPTNAFSIAGTPVQLYRIIILGIGLAAVLVLTLFLRRSRHGIAMRAVVEDPDLLDITGTNPNRIRRYAWLIGSVTASASGVMLVPLLPVDATVLTLLIVTGFGAAALGAFTSLPLTYLGGLVIGVAQALLQKYVPDSTGLLGGLSGSLPFLILLVLLLFAPRLRPPSTAKIMRRVPTSPWQPPLALRGIRLLVLMAVLIAVPAFAGLHLVDWTRFVAYIVVFLSLGLLVRTSGQISLAQISFMAIGVCAFSQFVAVHHWPWLAALLVVALITAPIGALLAIPAIRFPGIYLALATLGFGVLLEQMFYAERYMFGPFNTGITVPIPHLAALGLVGPKGYYYVVLAAAIIVSTLVVLVDHSRLGRLLHAMRDSPAGLASCGTSINISRVLVFSLAASLAAVGGVLDGGALRIVGFGNYDPLLSLQLFVVVLLIVGRSPWYAVLAAAAQTLFPAYITLSATVNYAFTFAFGVFAIQMGLSGSMPVPRRVTDAIDRLFGVATPSLNVGSSGFEPEANIPMAPVSLGSTPPTSPRPQSPVLRVDHVTVRYGGVTAADGISLSAESGRITGLIGPNGAGKTTIFNACAGAIRQHSGHIYLDGRCIDRWSTPARARRGLGRTFQQVELFDSLSVRENVSLGCEGGYAGKNPINHLVTRRRQGTAIRQRARHALEICGIAEFAETPAGDLTTGQRRMVELARCLAGNFKVLLLDEPAAGLDAAETRRIGLVLRNVVRQWNVGVLLIEHDISLVTDICDYVYVIDFGKQLFEGSPAEVAAAPSVRAAYLGESGEAGADTEGIRNGMAHQRVAGESLTRHVDPSTSVLEVQDVTSGYGKMIVLRGVSLKVYAGQVVALIGPNGAGKTTLLRTVCGVVRPQSGAIVLDGADVTSRSPYWRTRAGLCLIPEGRGIFRGLTVQENLRLQVPADEAKPSEALERALTVFPQLADRMNQLAGSMSGGQQQMLSLARAYVTNPRVILLDEVSMGLAPLVVDEMFSAMHNLARAGIAMLVVEQYVTRAIELSDRVVFLNRGTVSYDGPASGLDDDAVLRGYLGTSDRVHAPPTADVPWLGIPGQSA